MNPSALPPILAPAPRRRAGPTLIGITCFAVLSVCGLYVADRMAEKRAQEEADQRAGEVIRRAIQDELWIREAIAARRAILGMNRPEVRMAKGQPDRVGRGEVLTDDDRRLGIVEEWAYRIGDGKQALVSFDMDGYVVFSTDVPNGLAPGSRVRR